MSNTLGPETLKRMKHIHKRWEVIRFYIRSERRVAEAMLPISEASEAVEWDFPKKAQFIDAAKLNWY